MSVAANHHSAERGLILADLHSDLAGPFELKALPGDAIIITGRSGSGKSLFLRMLADLDVNVGSVFLDGKDRGGIAAADWRALVMYVAAESGWWFDTVAEHFAAQDLPNAIELGAALGLSRELLSAPVAQLSSGERQRWSLIRAVVRQPRVLLLDEPTGALDQSSVERVEAFLRRQVEQGTILILVTHDPGLAGRMGGRRFEMVDRKLRAI